MYDDMYCFCSEILDNNSSTTNLPCVCPTAMVFTIKKIADDVYHTRGYFSAVNKIFSAKWMAIEKYDVFSAYLNGRGRHLDAAPTAEDVD